MRAARGARRRNFARSPTQFRPGCSAMLGPTRLGSALAVAGGGIASRLSDGRTLAPRSRRWARRSRPRRRRSRPCGRRSCPWGLWHRVSMRRRCHMSVAAQRANSRSAATHLRTCACVSGGVAWPRSAFRSSRREGTPCRPQGVLGESAVADLVRGCYDARLRTAPEWVRFLAASAGWRPLAMRPPGGVRARAHVTERPRECARRGRRAQPGRDTGAGDARRRSRPADWLPVLGVGGADSTPARCGAPPAWWPAHGGGRRNGARRAQTRAPG